MSEEMLTPDDQIRFFTSEKRKLTLDELFEYEMYEMNNLDFIYQPCEICENRNQESMHKHHIDHNHNNNNPSNLMFLCANCHMELHRLLKRKYFAKWCRASIKEKLQIGKEAKDKLTKEKKAKNEYGIRK